MLEQHKCHTVLFRKFHCYSTWTAVGSKVATLSPVPQGNQRMSYLVTEESPSRAKNDQWVWLHDWVEGVYRRARLYVAVYPYFYCIGKQLIDCCSIFMPQLNVDERFLIAGHK